MALTITEVISGPRPAIPIKNVSPFGDKLIVVSLSVAFDSSYPTGGEVIDLSPYFGDTGGILLACFVPEDTQGYVCKYIGDTNRTMAGGLLKLYYADYDAEADGVLIEAANELDVSALTAVRVIAFGVVG